MILNNLILICLLSLVLRRHYKSFYLMRFYFMVWMLLKHWVILNLPTFAVDFPCWIDAFLFLCPAAVWGWGCKYENTQDQQTWLLPQGFSHSSPVICLWASSSSLLPALFSRERSGSGCSVNLYSELQEASFVLCCLPSFSQALLVSELMRFPL